MSRGSEPWLTKVFLVCAIAAAGLVFTFWVSCLTLYAVGYRIYSIPTAAMQPTIQKGERTIGRLSETYRTRAKRFDVVIYTRPEEPGVVYTKRIVGLSGEHIVIDASGILINGEKLALPPAVNREGLATKKCDVVIPDDAVFLLGDFTPNSADSRYVGPVLKKDLVGYLVFKE